MRGITMELNWKGILAIFITFAILIFALGFVCNLGLRKTQVTKFTEEEIEQIIRYKDMQKLTYGDCRNIVVYRYSNGQLMLGLEDGD